jgi:CheY-like chemotaxis protein
MSEPFFEWERDGGHHQALGRLTGALAHDFNNLLAVITASAELLEFDLEDHEGARERLRDIREASLKGAELVRRLMAFGRQQVLEPIIIDFNVHIPQLCRELSAELGPSIELRYRLDSEAACARVDPRQLGQVLRALVLNAREAMPEGGTISLDVEAVDLRGLRPHRGGSEPSPCVMLAVSDTGTGMDEITRVRAFEPFYTTKPPESGRGLGLSTAYGIVKQSGGTVWLDSAPGEGTTVAVYFPRVTSEAVGSEGLHSPPVSSEQPTKVTILLVDDEAVLRRAIRRLLISEGYEVLEASSPNEALELARRHGPAISLVLTDVVMPNMTGLELVVRLRDLIPNAKALLMSGHSADAVEYRGQARAPFLQKPVGRVELLATVRSVLLGQSHFPGRAAEDSAKAEVA